MFATNKISPAFLIRFHKANSILETKSTAADMELRFLFFSSWNRFTASGDQVFTVTWQTKLGQLVTVTNITFEFMQP